MAADLVSVGVDGDVVLIKRHVTICEVSTEYSDVRSPLSIHIVHLFVGGSANVIQQGNKNVDCPWELVKATSNNSASLASQ